MIAAATLRKGTVQYMAAVTETTIAGTASTEWSDIASTQLQIAVPAGEHDFFQITFSADDPSCARSDAAYLLGFCHVRALVDGKEVLPGSAKFGSSLGSAAFPYLGMPATMQWVSGVLAPGTHYFKMQFRTGNGDHTMALYRRTMTVVRVRAY